MLRTFAKAAGILALLAGPALAQVGDTSPSAQPTLGVPFNQQPPPSQEDIEKRRAAERDYNAAMQKIPDKKASSDPWGDVRPTASASKKKPQQ
jgi:hypothetical protein